MELSDKIIAVGKMQKHIEIHLDEEITLDHLSRAAGYCKYHALRIFKELTHKTPFETIRALRLTKAAKNLRDSGIKVMDAALDNGFGSHDGFTRAFKREFDITPQKYQHESPAVRWFTYNGIYDKGHFHNNSRPKTYNYGHKFENNSLYFNVSGLDFYNPFGSCSRTQMIF